MENYKVGQDIFKIEIKKYKNDSYSDKSGLFVEKLNILGVSEYKVIFNNDWFTSVSNDKRENYRRDLKYNTYIDYPSVRIVTNNSLFREGVFITLYSTKRPSKVILNKMVSQASLEIEKTYGFLFEGFVNELYSIVDNGINKN